MFEITPAALEDQESIRRLLGLCPYREIPPRGEQAHFVVRSPQGVVGTVGGELLADGSILLRTLIVIPGYRKRQLARQLLLRLIAFGADRQAPAIYAPGSYAADYLSRFGFAPCPPMDVPEALRAPDFSGIAEADGQLMRRCLQTIDTEPASDVAATARRHFDGGFLCAESVLAAVAHHLNIRSPIIPGIATGFCNGVAGTWGTCGAISGGVLAINLILGRQVESAPVNENYRAVRHLIQEFQCCHGSTQCSELLACDLESAEGRTIYRTNHLHEQCREYVGTAAAIALRLIGEAGKDTPGSKPAGKPAWLTQR